MANPDHLEMLRKDVEEWNSWRKENPLIYPVLIGADLKDIVLFKANLSGVNLSQANLSGAFLAGADLFGADLTSVNLTGANLINSDLLRADLTDAILVNSELSVASLVDSDLTGADLSGADLTGADLTRATIEGTIFNKCKIYGINVWDCKGEIAGQKDLIITPVNQPEVTVDNIKIAQFIYLLLENKEIRNVIDTLTSKAVLILGRFKAKRKAVLDAIKDELRREGYLPILFDFEKPVSRNYTETIVTLASMSRFVIADITKPRSIPQELQAIVTSQPSIPIMPIILNTHKKYPLFDDLNKDQVLPLYNYSSLEELILSLKEKVIEPAESRVEELKK